MPSIQIQASSPVSAPFTPPGASVKSAGLPQTYGSRQLLGCGLQSSALDLMIRLILSMLQPPTQVSPPLPTTDTKMTTHCSAGLKSSSSITPRHLPVQHHIVEILVHASSLFLSTWGHHRTPCGVDDRVPYPKSLAIRRFY